MGRYDGSDPIPERLWPSTSIIPSIDPRANRCCEHSCCTVRTTDPSGLCLGHKVFLDVALSHLKGYCHDTSKCPICLAEKAGYDRGYSAAIKMVAEG